MRPQLSTRLFLACLPIAPTLATLSWSPCPSHPSLDCTTLTVPLEYADPTNGSLASIPLARFNATAPKSHRKGPLLTNPGGPGSSGIDFLANGAGEGISNITGGLYDIVSWDPRGVGAARPLLQCFANAGEEARAADMAPAAAEIAYSQLWNQSYAPAYYAALQEYDSAVAELADACVSRNSPALYTSSAAYVVRDMAAIADALAGKTNATLNYWGLSYGTIFGAEFIQTYPQRVGRVVLDGVFDPAANAQPYTSQLPNDELSVRDALSDLATFCTQAGPEACALSKPPRNSTDVQTRLATLQESLYENPIDTPDGSLSVTVGIFSFIIYSFLKLPTTWPTVASAVSALEHGDASRIANLLTDGTATADTDVSAPDTGSFAGWPLQCIDNAPSSQITLSDVARLVRDISMAEKTPWLNADLATVSFCRNFPDKRPRIPNLGASKLTNLETNAALMARDTAVLIVNAQHDPSTPVTSAQTLHNWLPTSSQLVTRQGPGHTSISLASLGLVHAIRGYLLDEQVPATEEVHDVNQVVFSSEIDSDLMTPAPVFNGSYSEEEKGLLESTYQVFLAFLTLP
ncbi:Alpha/Beta hydrolase protein [Aspergillus aurantiobrunneus]